MKDTRAMKAADINSIREWMEREYFPDASIPVPTTDGFNENYFVSEIIQRYISRHYPGWIEIVEGEPETLPSDENMEVLVAHPRGVFLAELRKFQRSEWEWLTRGHGYWPVSATTHWTVPQPPDEVKR